MFPWMVWSIRFRVVARIRSPSKVMPHVASTVSTVFITLPTAAFGRMQNRRRGLSPQGSRGCGCCRLIPRILALFRQLQTAALIAHTAERKSQSAVRRLGPDRLATISRSRGIVCERILTCFRALLPNELQRADSCIMAVEQY